MITCFGVIYIFIDASWCNNVHVIVVVVFQINDSIVVVVKVIIDTVVHVIPDAVDVHVIIGAVVIHVTAVAEVGVAIFKISGCVVAVHVVIVLFFNASNFCVVVINIIVVVDVVGTGVDVNVCVGVDVSAGIGSGIIVAVDFVLFNC